MEGEIGRIVPALITPCIQFVLAIAFAFAWSIDRQRKYLLLIMAAYMAFSLGGITQVLLAYGNLSLQSMLSGGLYTASAILASKGILMRYQLSLKYSLCLAFFAIIMVSLWYFNYVKFSILSHIYVQNFGYGFLLLATALRIQPHTRISCADRAIFWTLLISGALFIPRTLLTTTLPPPATVESFANSTFWHSLQFSLAISGLALALSILAASTSDVMNELRKDRDLDPLTQLLNRRGLMHEMNGPTMTPGVLMPGSLIACDIDHFKKINDTFGHSAGDSILATISDIIRRTIRSGDSASRIGGEEFAIWLPGTNLKEASECAERLRNAIATTVFSVGSMHIHATATFGVASATAGECWLDILKRADICLYKAKRAGRNRTISS
ncbi:diguanylate cyclase [Stenotrophomonas sp. LARHCG68]